MSLVLWDFKMTCCCLVSATDYVLYVESGVRVVIFCICVVTDEDFAFAKAPPSKKPRESGKLEGKKSSSKPSSQDSQSTASQQSRYEILNLSHQNTERSKMMYS